MAAAAITEKFVGNTTSGGGGIVSSSSAARSKPSTSAGATANSCDNDSNGHTCYTYEEVTLERDMDGVEDHHYHTHHHHRHHQYKLPIWVGCNCKLVSGISKSTTCHDLIASIAPSSQDPSKYVLVEKWKKMERILDPSVKILKVWKAWGDQIGDVSFVLRSAPPADGYIDKKSSRKIHRKRSSSYHQQKEEDCDKEEHRDAMEQLIKLVLTQGEAIQAQLKKLRQQEVQIERYEEKMHKIRSSQHGENYVVDTYLKDDVTKSTRKIKRREKSPCKRDAHGSHHNHHHHHRQSRREQLQDLQQPQHPEQSVQQLETESPPKKHVSSSNPAENTEHVEEDAEDSADLNDEESTELIKEKTEMMENIFQINVKLTQEEEQLVKLGLKLRKLSDKQRKAEWEELAMQDIKQELEHLKTVTNEQSQEIESNEMNLTALEQLLDDKHDHVAFLTHELQLMDEESEMLQRKVLERTTSTSAGNSQQQSNQLEQPSLPPQQVQFHPTTTATVQDPSMAVYSNQYHHQQQFDYQQDELLQSLMKCSIKTSSSSSSRGGGDQAILPTSQNTYHIQPPPPPSHHQQLCTTTATVHNYPQQLQAPSSPQVQHTPVDGCSSSCSNSSSSVCVQLSQKQCISTNSKISSLDPQDNDSNSDTGISSLHSSVDENPMYVLDTLV